METEQLFKLASDVSVELAKLGASFIAHREAETGDVTLKSSADPDFAFTLESPRWGDKKNRLVVRGRYGGLRDFLAYKDKSVSGSFAPDSDARRIARQLMSALWPEYSRQVAAAQAKRAEHRALAALVQAAAGELEQHGLSRSTWSADNRDTRVDLWGDKMKAEVSAYDARVTIRLVLDDLTPEQAKEILDSLKEKTK